MVTTVGSAKVTSRQRKQAVPRPLAYQSGFGNELPTEAVAGALPIGRNSPQRTRPDYVEATMAFMFETRCVMRPMPIALRSAQLQADYHECWQELARHFDPAQR